MKRSLFPLAAMLLSLVAAGCGGAGGLCDAICDCTGDCSENDRNDCYDDVDDAERRADNEGCSSEFSEYAGCLDSEFECRDNGSYDVDGCGGEAEDLNDCMKGRGGGDDIDF